MPIFFNAVNINDIKTINHLSIYAYMPTVEFMTVECSISVAD
jgi:hypothetical protein